MTPPTRARCYLAVLAMTVTACFAEAEELTLKELNCAFTMPTGWNKWPVNQTNHYALIKSPNELKTLIFSARPARGVTVVDEPFAHELRNSFLNSGVTLKSARHLSMAGVPAYELGGEMSFQGKQISMVSRVIIVGDKAYKLEAMYLEGDALSDRDLQRCLDSFRFLDPVPSPSARSTLRPKMVFGWLAGVSVVLLALILRGGLNHLETARSFGTLLYLNLLAWALLLALHAFWYFANAALVTPHSIHSVANIFGIFGFLGAGVSISWLMQRGWSPYLAITLSIICVFTLWKLHIAALVLSSMRGSFASTASEWWTHGYGGLNALWLIELAFLTVSIPLWTIYGAVRKRKGSTVAAPPPST